VCSDVSLFSSYQVTRDSSVMMENGLHASVYGVGTVDLKLTLEKDRAAGERVTYPFYQQDSS
jgi:hypothetical protein